MNCVSCDICVYHLWFVFFSLGYSLAPECPMTTDLIMRVNVRTTTTTINSIHDLTYKICFMRLTGVFENLPLSLTNSVLVLPYAFFSGAPSRQP